MTVCTAEDGPHRRMIGSLSCARPEKAQKQPVEESQSLPTPCVFCHLDRVLSPLLSAKMRRDDLTRFVVTLKKDHGLGSNTILHNAVIVAQILKRHGRSGITRELSLPERITPL